MTAPTDALLTLNAGSSSLKFALFGMTGDLPRLAVGKVAGLGDTPKLQVRRQGQETADCTPLARGLDIDGALAQVMGWLSDHTQYNIHAVAHRIVHGGPRFDGPVELDRPIIDYLTTLIPLAPLHQPHNLAAVTAMAIAHPGLRQFGCFDTAFHATLAPLATSFALPAAMRDQGIRRYGFHGLSYAWIARSLPTQLAQGRVVAAHLGNGASLCAMHGGRSVDTTMGLTALDGLPMGTRSGALDPGAVLYMQNVLDMTTAQVEAMLYEESGLKGLSGLTGDVATLLASPDPLAGFALDYFVHKTAQQIAAMAVSLGGVDGVIFTGGIGENAVSLRERIVAALGWLGPLEVHVIAADEERAMVHEVANLLTR